MCLCVHTCHVPLPCGLAFSACPSDLPLIILVATDKSGNSLWCVRSLLKGVVDKNSLVKLFGNRAENKALGDAFLKFAFYIISVWNGRSFIRVYFSSCEIWLFFFSAEHKKISAWECVLQVYVQVIVNVQKSIWSWTELAWPTSKCCLCSSDLKYHKSNQMFGINWRYHPSSQP